MQPVSRAMSSSDALHATLMSHTQFLDSSRIDESHSTMLAQRSERRQQRNSPPSAQEIRSNVLKELSVELQRISDASDTRAEEFYPAALTYRRSESRGIPERSPIRNGVRESLRQSESRHQSPPMRTSPVMAQQYDSQGAHNSFIVTDDVTPTKLCFDESTSRSELMHMIVGLRKENARLHSAFSGELSRLKAEQADDIMRFESQYKNELREKTAEVDLLQEEVRAHEASIANLLQLTNTIRQENTSISSSVEDVRHRAEIREKHLLTVIESMENSLNASANAAVESPQVKEYRDATLSASLKEADAVIKSQGEEITQLRIELVEAQARFDDELNSSIAARDADKQEMMAFAEELVGTMQVVVERANQNASLAS